MNVLDLFSGIGGFSLGLERAGMRTLAFCESDPDCVSTLRRHWPDVPVFGDIRSLTVEPGFAEVFCGGFPCQPFSTAARGRNNAADLWPAYLRLVREGRPDWVCAENVPGIGHAGIERVCRGLEAEDYSVRTFDADTALPARQRGRHRILWVAHANGESEPRRALDAEMAGLRPLSRHGWADEPAPVGMDDVLPGRMDALHQLGNSFTPYFAELLGRAIVRASR